MSKRDPDLYIEDIRNSIERIESYTEDMDFDGFVEDPKTIDAVIRNLSIIGEAVRNLPEQLKSEYPGIPWKEIVGMRNKVVHEYFGVDEEILWETAKKDLADFKKQIAKIKF
jgi:uncharacterized protein with HEPN domain